VQADEAAFRKTQDTERLKQAKTRKVQEHVDRTREQNARRKLDKIQSREWDSGKKTSNWNRGQSSKSTKAEVKIRSPSLSSNGVSEALTESVPDIPDALTESVDTSITTT